MELKLVFEDLGDFVQAYKGRISIEGMEIETDIVHSEGTVLELTIALRDELVLIQGNAGVLRSREDRGPSAFKCIMLLRFVELDDDSKSLIERMEERHETEGVPPFNLEKTLEEWIEPPPRHSGKPGVAEAVRIVRPPGSQEETPEQKSEVPVRTEIAAQAASQSQNAQDGDVLHAVATALDPPTTAGRSRGDVAADPDLSPTGRTVPRALIVGLAAVALAVISVAAVLFFLPEFVGLSGDGDTASGPVATSERPTGTEDDPGEDPPEGSMTMVSGVATALPVRPNDVAESTPAPSPTAEATATPQPTPEPPEPTPVPEPAAPVSHVEGITWSTSGNASEAVIRGNGPFSDSQVTNFRLDSDPGPRIVLQIKRIDRSSVELKTAVDGPRIAAIRAWHHSERKPPELQVVFDLATPRVSLDSITTNGDTIVVRLVSP